MGNQTEEVELPTFDELPLAYDDQATGGDQPSLSALLGVSKVDAASTVMDRIEKVERLLESLLQRLPDESVTFEDSPQNVKDWRRAYKSPKAEEPKPVVIELDDAQNSGSVSRYMEQLLIRMRAGNSVIPSPATNAESTEADAGSCNSDIVSDARDEDTEAAVVLNPLPEEIAPRPEPRAKLTKDEIRAQNSSLREVANLSARQAISKHSMQRYKTELTAKAVISVVAFAIAMSIFIANLRSANEYLWQSLAAFITVAVVVFDFLTTLRRFPDTPTSTTVSTGPSQVIVRTELDVAEDHREVLPAERHSEVAATETKNTDPEPAVTGEAIVDETTAGA